jgi:beta-glucanase (GH16 family)
VYAVEWTENKMVFSVDSVKHYTYQPDDINSSTWPFNSEQYLLMNFAVQGNISSGFTQGALEVDYVRIYQDPVSNIFEQAKVEPIHFPNPFTDQLHIMLNTGIDESVDVVIQSADGAIILNRKANVINGNLHLNALEELSAGLYFIGISSNAAQYQFKAIKTL